MAGRTHAGNSMEGIHNGTPVDSGKARPFKNASKVIAPANDLQVSNMRKLLMVSTFCSKIKVWEYDNNANAKGNCILN